MSSRAAVVAAAILLLLLLLVAAWFWQQRQPLTNPRPAGRNIIAFGDSLTAGVGANDGRDYPAVLSQLLGVPVFNRGVPGDTTRDALARLAADVLEHDPRIVIVCLGGNDGLQGVPPDQTFANLRQIVTAIQARGALVVLVGIRSPTLTDQYEKPFRQLARQTGCLFVPNILAGILTDPSKKSDPIHPNDAGYRLMAERIAKAIAPHLQ